MPGEGEQEVSGFLTTEANVIVAPIHPKALPVILTLPAEVDYAWGRDAGQAGATAAIAERSDCGSLRVERADGVPITA